MDSADRPDLNTRIDPEEAMTLVVRGWLEISGPITGPELSRTLSLPVDLVQAALLTLEGEGQVLRGQFREKEKWKKDDSLPTEWCNRRLLARIHRRTVAALRREIEPVAASDFMRFLFRWQHRAPGIPITWGSWITGGHQSIVRL